MNGKMPVLFGEQVRYIVGGPFLACPTGPTRDGKPWIRIKLAAEIDAPCEIDIPAADFNVPRMDDMVDGVAKAIYALAFGWPVYAGCMGGIGRTGLFMSCLAKVTGVLSPISYVRGTYLRHAVEKPIQEQFVEKFPIERLKLVHEAAETFLWVPTAEAAMQLEEKTRAIFEGGLAR